MSEESQILIAADSGTQTVIPQLAMSAPQVVYLDFDGAETSYNGELLTIDNVVMEDSGFDMETITIIVAALNEQFGDDVVFMAELPQTDEYSTIYIGVTSAFEAFGDFLGLAETIDSGNQIHDDNAFVFLNSATATELVTSVIAHEAKHIVHGMEHEGEGLDRYTAVMTISGTNNVFRISSGETLNVNNSVIEYSVNGSGQIWPSPVFQVLAGGILTNATLKREEYFGYTLKYSAFVMRDGAAYGITVSGGVLEVQDNTNLYNITFSSGDFNLLHGGENVFFHGNNYVKGDMAIEGVYIQNDAKFYVQNGGVMNYTTVNSGLSIGSGKDEGYLVVNNGGEVNSTILNSAGWLEVYRGGVANETIINSSGVMNLWSGGTANGVILNPGGYLDIWEGGSALNIKENGGTIVGVYVDLENNPDITFAPNVMVGQIFSGNYTLAVTLHSGTTVLSSLIQKSACVYSGGLIESSINSGGSIQIFNGGIVDSIQDQWGNIWVYDGGLLNRATCSSGNVWLFDGGSANSITIDNKGSLTLGGIFDGSATATAITVCSGGSMDVGATRGNFVVISTLINSSGLARITSGGTGSNTFVDYGGKCYVSGGGLLKNTMISSGGTLVISSAGTASSIYVDHVGKCYVGNGGLIDNAVVSSNGSLIVSSNAILRGTIMIGGSMTLGGSVDASGASITFDIAQRTTSDTAMVNSISAIDSGTYSIRVATDQTEGQYKLAGNAADFDQTVTLTVKDTDLTAELTKGVTTTVNGMEYTLDTVDGVLSLNVETASVGSTYVSQTVSSGSMILSNGDSAISTTILVGGSVIVFNGGLADESMVGSQGYLLVSEGGVANSTMVSSAGRMYVYRGGTANETTVMTAGGMLRSLLNLYGVANSTTLGSGGGLVVSKGGFANSVTVQSGGYLSVSSGGTATAVNAAAGASANLLVAPDTYVAGTSNGKAFQITNVANAMEIGRSMTLKVIAGGTASSISVDAGGSLTVSSGGTALRIREDGGYVYAYEGATVTFVPNVLSGLIVENDDVSLHSGTTAVSTTVNSGGRLYVFNGGDASLTTVNSSGGIYVSSGGTATSTTVHSSGFIQVTKEGAANSTTVGVGGKMVVYSGGVANEAVVDSTGELWVSGNGTATSATVLAGGSLIACSSGVLNDAVVSSSGWMVVFSNGVANSTIIESDGDFAVRVGGTANYAVVNTSGHLEVSSGGEANSATIEGGRLWVWSGGIANSAVVHSDGATIVKNLGTAFFTEVSSYGYMAVSSGGTAVSTTVCSLGLVYVSDGGKAISTFFSGSYIYPDFGADVANARLYVFSGGEAQSTTVGDGGYIEVSSGGTADSIIVDHEGLLIIRSGGTGLNILENGGRVWIADDADVTFIPNVLSSIEWNHPGTLQCMATLHSGTTAVSMLMDNGTGLDICKGGKAFDTTLKSYGHIVVSSGGTANDTAINNEAYMQVSSGGTASSVIISSGGTLNISQGGYVTGIEAHSGASLDLAIASDTFVQGTVDGKAFAFSNYVSGFEAEVDLSIESGGTAVATNVDGLYVGSGGTALSALVGTSSWGYMTVNNGGMASLTRVGRIGHFTVDGGLAVSTVIESGGSMSVWYDWDDDRNHIIGSAVGIENAGKLNLQSDTYARNVILVSGGSMTFAGTIEHLTIRYGATASNSSSTYSSPTQLSVLKGSVHLGGTLTLTEAVDASNAGVSFDIDNRTITDDVIVNDITLLDALEYYVNVSVDQSAGQYKLAGNAADFNETVTLTMADTDLTAELTKGVTTSVNGKDYTLNTVDGVLCLDVAENMPAITITVDDKTMIYGNAMPRLTYAYDGTLAAGHSLTVTLNLTVDDAYFTASGHLKAGIYAGAITATATVFDKNGNDVTGDYAINYDFGDLIVDRRNLNVTVSSKSMVYGNAMPDFEGYGYTYDSNSLANGDTLDINLKYTDFSDEYLSASGNLAAGLYVGCITVGSYSISGGNDNYNISINTGNLMVTPRNATVGFSAYGKIYDGTTTAMHSALSLYDVIDGDNVRVFDNDVTYAFDSKNVGSGKNVTATGSLTYVGKDAGNYSFTFNNTSLASITPLDVTIGFTANDKVYDGTTAATRDGLVMDEIIEGDDVAFDDSSIDYVFDDKNIGDGKTVTAIGFDVNGMLSGDDLANYNILFVDTASADITPLDVTIGFTANDKVYDGTTVATRDELVMDEIIEGDDVVFDDSSLTYAFSDAEPGSDKTVTATGFSSEAISGEDRQNYNITFVDTASADIIAVPVPTNLVGNGETLSWSVVEGASGYVVEYSQDNFATCVTVETASVGMEHYNVGAGTWQWRVRTIEGTEWAVGNDITISAPDTSPSVVSASANGVKDVFFVKPNGVWSDAWMAEHMGVHGEWAGTGETIVFGGENRFGDIFQGSTDENILLLTDDANGDALFVYDIYTDSKDDLAKFQNRLSDIKEIHAGAGDDIVDLTSDEFDYAGGGLSIHGGLGDDTIWANAGDNTLFGDVGNDRLVGAGGNDVIVGGVGDDSMHGGGGNDIFAFGDIDWGNDTVEQLPGGDFRLWFAEGMKLGNANGDIKLMLDGGDTVVQRVGTSNTVRVKGLANAEVSSRLIFGSGTYNGLDYSSLSAMGAFSPFGTERVFDKKNRGMLA